MSEIFEILKLGDKELHNLFKEIVGKTNYTNPSQFIGDCWAEYEKQSGSKSADSSKNRNGQFLELLVQYILCKKYLERYIEECCFKYNNRNNPNMFELILTNSVR